MVSQIREGIEGERISRVSDAIVAGNEVVIIFKDLNPVLPLFFRTVCFAMSLAPVVEQLGDVIGR